MKINVPFKISVIIRDELKRHALLLVTAKFTTFQGKYSHVKIDIYCQLKGVPCEWTSSRHHWLQR